ncbi:aldo/keto reductase [Xylella fastidiosa]|nr:aldo/keto reductase [Xylella fastidiosa]ETE31717.1 oxidoreductase [Xylella fastidiosa 32]MDG5822908.1 aldo/keto reductase [Xylella fastidiosa subsp. pauca]MDG5825248.1 aldo/keto reductase [Xylella fastidiosa subsp. pauca]WGZ31144.1 aldo/keto reductase [Xylella fastidiosa subsp. pauca]WGZ35195.1 aldo/keto reductase [Xylella fastidiosa subsp. pauca]
MLNTNGDADPIRFNPATPELGRRRLLKLAGMGMASLAAAPLIGALSAGTARAQSAAAARAIGSGNYKHLGRTGLKVSRIALGCMNFGELTDEPNSFRIMSEALDSGVNLFDTADVYGGPQTPDMEKGFGTSEEYIGRWLAQDKSRRDRIVLATKVYQPMGTGPNDKYLSAYHIRRACEASLKRLKTDHIDLYQMHHVDRSTPWQEIWQAMEQLVREGKITYVGSSNFAAWDIARAQGVAESRNFLGLVSEQSLYNLIQRTIELEVIPAVRELGIGLIPWSPIGMGLLGGVLGKITEGRRATPGLQAQIQKFRPQLEAYEALCRELGQPPAVVALAWVIHNPVVTAAISGPRTVEQMRENLKALSLNLSSETLAKLDEIWPGPGGEAPKAYAW